MKNNFVLKSMKTEEKNTKNCCEKYTMFKKHPHYNNSNPIYGLGVIGALFYFLQNASTFSSFMIGIGKAIFWPAILMFKLLSYLKL